MRRFLRLLTLCLLALALPIQGAAAALAAPPHAGIASHRLPAATATLPDVAMHPLPHAAACPHHAVDKAGCGACCGPAVAQRPALLVAPVAARWAPMPRNTAAPAAPQFLTDGPDRPPRTRLA